MNESNFDFNKYRTPSNFTPPSSESGEVDPYIPPNVNIIPQKKPKKNLLPVFLLIVLILSGGGLGYWWISQENKTPNTPQETPNLIPVQPPSGDTLTTAQIYEKVSPSVVGIVVYSKTSQLQASGYGSGVVLNQEGHVITNAHVIDGAAGIKVVLHDGTEQEASIVGIDIKTDLAVIKVPNGSALTPAEFADSNIVKPGEEIVAIGNPSGPQLAGSITKGIISGVNREIESYGGIIVKAIQVDAAINPGNSGGALVNMYGQVIGINSSKISATDFEGIGFAIPMADVQPIISNLLEFGYVKDRVKLGVTVLAIDEILSKLNGLPIGLYIREIEGTSTLANAGVQAGDVITHFNNEEMSSSQNLVNTLLQHKPGDSVTLKLFRKEVNGVNGKTFDVTIQLDEDKSTLVVPK